MAITTVNAAYPGQAPVFTGQILARNLSDPDSRMYAGTATATGDGASSTFSVNWIDGTNVLPFTPTGLVVVRSGGAATATISVVSAVPTNATKFDVTTSATVNAATFIVSFIAWK